MSSLTFLGAAGTVTGSKHLLDTGQHRVLVDCGLFQGLKELRLRNWSDLPVPAASIDAVILTHAHLDHCGYLPRLVAQGFAGTVFCTGGTRELCHLVLTDSARIQEEDARDANRHGYSKHKVALPLYTSADADAALSRLQPIEYNRSVAVVPGVDVTFINAGHLLGSSYARVTTGGKTILFGGDLGRFGRPVLPDPQPVDKADVLLLESTYGDRLHDPDDNGEHLASLIRAAVARGGKLIIPAFAIGRVEEVIYWLRKLELERRIPVLPVFLDSPMAARALQFYTHRATELDSELHRAEHDVCVFCTTRMTIVASPQQSMDLVASHQPSIVIASSGMATGGRVLYHLAAMLPDKRNTVLFVGYQAAGTRGRSLVDGAKTLKMKGRDIPVGATIESIESMSAHADAGEIMRWLSNFSAPPALTCLVHGEAGPLAALRERILKEKGWNVHVAKHLETVPVP